MIYYTPVLMDPDRRILTKIWDFKSKTSSTAFFICFNNLALCYSAKVFNSFFKIVSARAIVNCLSVDFALSQFSTCYDTCYIFLYNSVSMNVCIVNGMKDQSPQSKVLLASRSISFPLRKCKLSPQYDTHARSGP